MPFYGFHPLVERWFFSRFEAPTEPQQAGWPHIAAGEDTLIAAPTGSGKTLTAFLSCIDRLLKESLERPLPDEVRVVYVSPLRALSNDMHRNLTEPLREINALASGAVVSGEWSEDAIRRSQDGSQTSEVRGRRSDGAERKSDIGERNSVLGREPLENRTSHHSTKLQSPITNQQSTDSAIRAGLRTGDTSASKRAALVRRPPHILVTTPESLYLMLTAPRARETLRNAETVIVDEIHALVRDKRGSHLALSLERLEALTTKRLQRIGLSATQKPIERTAAFLVGTSPRAKESRPCSIVNVGHQRDLDLAIETPASELGPVCSLEQWQEVHQRLVELINAHRSTLIFVNTRRLAERLSHQLTELLGEDAVSSHHGSLSAPIRLKTEQRLKTGQLKAVVATASLELGIDIGYIDLVVQIGSPRWIATFLQRIGRSGHSLGLVPKGRLFALTRDELLECMALMRAIAAGRLDAVRIPETPLDVLAQQIVAETSAREWGTDELFEQFRRAYPYRNLSREDFHRVIEYLSDGIAKSSGRSRVYLHHDHVRERLRARRGARIPATSNAGAIPEIFQYRVVAEPDRTVVGSVDEDFAVESLAGDVFLLGNTSWRILSVRGGDVNVCDAHGAPPTIPFWFGEAPGRSFELSQEVSQLREELEQRLRHAPVGRLSKPFVENVECQIPIDERMTKSECRNDAPECHSMDRPDGLESHPTQDEVDLSPVIRWLSEETNASVEDARQAVEYAAAQKAAVGLLPTQRRIVFERFFDESGGMQLVVHAPFGGQINRAWGLAMRKRFCRSYDFELQATADDDGFILSLGPQHSFPIESLFPMLTRGNARGLLEQAVLAAPMFELRWRWNVTRSLLVLRRNNGKKVPPAIQRFRAQDLLTAVFPRLTGCQEEHTGDIPVPDHPLVRQTMDDCLSEAVDLDGLHRVLEAVERGEITLVARDTREPSPFSYELLNANPYAFLDGGEIQERRTRAVSARRTQSLDSADDLGRLDPEAIARVQAEAQPPLRNADELHDLLLSRILLPVDELPSDERADCRQWFAELAEQRRAGAIALPDGRSAWCAAERRPAVEAVFPEARCEPEIATPATVRQEWPSAEARTAYVCGLLEICGPITVADAAQRLCLTESQAAASLEALEGEGLVLRGRFSPDLTAQQSRDWRDGGSRVQSPEPRTDEVDARTQAGAGLSTLGPGPSPEWCHRRLLARIHRLTLQGLRRQIEPVSVEVFQRFLFRHHGLLPGHRRSGSNGLFETLAMLQGIDVPTVCWERDVLPSRVEDYSSQLLDELCLTGEVGWGRLNPAKRDPDRSRPMVSLTRVAPISLFVREDAEWLLAGANEADAARLSTPARHVYELLGERGAMFAGDLTAATRMLPAQLNDALGELVTRGLVTADGFGGLRSLIAGKSTNRGRTSRRARLTRQRRSGGTIGRWSLWREGLTGKGQGPQSDERAAEQPGPGPSTLDRRPTDVEHWAWQLLRRWGVVFRDLLARESCAPRWFELLQVYRRMEARGEIRGGRFVAGVAGEQFALGEAVRTLRELRDEETPDELVIITAADPLNLTGILTDQLRVPGTAARQLAYLNGRFVAVRQPDVMIEFPEGVREELSRRTCDAFDEYEGRTAARSAADKAASAKPRQRKGRKKRRYPNDIPRRLF